MDERRTGCPESDEMGRAEQAIRRHAANLGEHPRIAWVEVAAYPPRPGAIRSIHLSAAFHDDGAEVAGVDHAALAARVSAETGLALDPEYTGVFRWQRRGAIVYWWDWRLPA